MSRRASQAKAPSAEQRYEVATQEVERLRAQLRDEAQAARREARAELRIRYRLSIAGLTIGALLVGGLIGHFGFGRTERAPETVVAEPDTGSGDTIDQPVEDPPDGATPWPLRVHVSGAVAEPQVVELAAGSLVADAIEAAGGAAPDADLDALNLAALVEDNQQIRVPALGTALAATPGNMASDELTQLVDINTASAETLATLPYIGETKAAAIVDYRTTNGAFARIEDIQEVPGIGPAIFGHIAHLITVEP